MASLANDLLMNLLSADRIVMTCKCPALCSFDDAVECIYYCLSLCCGCWSCTSDDFVADDLDLLLFCLLLNVVSSFSSQQLWALNGHYSRPNCSCLMNGCADFDAFAVDFDHSLAIDAD